jgi:DNA-binding NtrC family response regulator
MVREENSMKTVLVLEPNKILRSLYKDEIEDEEYFVYLVKDALEALAILKKTLVNILITEHQIEPTKGYKNLLDMAREVKQIPVIICTSHLRSLIDFEWWGEIEYVHKTSNLDVLKNTMREMLDYRCSIDRFYRSRGNLKQQELFF